MNCNERSLASLRKKLKDFNRRVALAKTVGIEVRFLECPKNGIAHLLEEGRHPSERDY